MTFEELAQVIPREPRLLRRARDVSVVTLEQRAQIRRFERIDDALLRFFEVEPRREHRRIESHHAAGTVVRLTIPLEERSQQ